LEELRSLEPDRILPNHGDPEVIAGGGYSSGLISATEPYIHALQAARDRPELRDAGLREFVGQALDAGWIRYFAPYEAVHRENLATVLAASESA
jgi:cyclase